MIRVTNLRTRGNEPAFDPMFRLESVDKAFELMVLYEFGYGGQITDISSEKVTIITRIMGCIDTTIFEGNAEEMSLLINYCSFHLNVLKVGGVFPEDAAKNVMEITKGNPLMIKLGAGMILGENIVKKSLLCMLETTDEPILKKAVTLESKELLSIVSLIHVDKINVEEVMSLVN